MYDFRTPCTQERSDPDTELTIECKRQNVKMRKKEALTALHRDIFFVCLFVKISAKVDMSVCLRKQKKIL